MNKKKKNFILCIVLLIFFITCSWFLCRKNISNKFNYNCAIQDKQLGIVLDVSRKNTSQVIIELISTVSNLKMELKQDGKVIDSFLLDEVLVESNVEQIVNEAKSINDTFWGLTKLTHQDIDVDLSLSVDIDNINNKISSLNCIKNYKQSNNAYLEKKNNEMVIISEVYGTEIYQDDLANKIKESIQEKDLVLDLDESNLYIKPEILESDTELVRQMNLYNKVVNLKVQYLFGDKTETVSKEMLSSWLQLVDGKLIFDEDAILAYIEDLAHTYNTFGTTRKFTTTNGQVIRVPAGDYGWSISQTKEVERLIEELQLGEDIRREPTWLYQGYGDYIYEDDSDIGDTYIEISIPEQTLWLYVDGNLILSSQFVSGTESNGNYTPSGVFGITYKTKNATLRGRGYATPVKYWMPFNNNIGMHDASWRSSFGGNIYKNSGSHGCINLPLDKAKEIYEYVDKFFPVIVYRQTELNNI